MKQIVIMIVSLVSLLGGGRFLLISQAQEQPLQQFVSRFEMIRALEEANCSTCLTPPLSWKQKFNPSWLEGFQRAFGNNFDDLRYEATFFDGKDYYYCVAHAGDQGWINGYPRLTSGLCQGSVCGENNARGTELVQMITNMIAPKFYKDYPLSFEKIQKWSIASGLVNDIQSLALINKGLQRCGKKPCVATSGDEFHLFMKYCSYHLDECSMKIISPFIVGQWPVAELNVLEKANILQSNDPMIARLGSLITKHDLERFLPSLQQVMQCASISDYDGDGLENDIDNCPDDYNPHQRNMDADVYGDVCDEDIDGDRSLNEKGLVDDSGRIVRQQQPGKDDCPLIATSALGLLDCPKAMENNLLAFDINADPVQAIPGQDIQFSSLVVGSPTTLVWDFGDGKGGVGFSPVHRYENPGTYSVQAHITSVFGVKLVSQAQVTIGNNLQTLASTVLTCSTLTGSTMTDFRCLFRVAGIDLTQATLLRRSRGDDSETLVYSSIQDAVLQEHRYRKPGTYTIQADLFFGLETLYSQKLVVYVVDENICLVGSEACDFDKDSIPDQCDADIDGDGVSNILGIVRWDNPECSFLLENIDTKILQHQIGAIKKGVVFDNCSFVPNIDQQDDDIDGIGNSCDATNIGTGENNQQDKGNKQPIVTNDSDSDGIPDDRDGCLNIPENMNGVEDADGCPELPKSCKPGSQCIGKPPSCITCPCPGADYVSELWKGDKVRAVLLDEAGQVIYRYSPAEIIDVNIPDKMLGK